MDRMEASATIDSILGQGKLDDASRQTVSNMAQLYDGSISYWEQDWGESTYDVKIAINGSFWDTTLNMPESGQILSGWYAKRFTDFTGGSGFSWTLNRGAFIGGCVRHIANRNQVAYPATGQDQNINSINVPAGSDSLVLYTPQFDAFTPPGNADEVLVRMSRPALVLPRPSFASGTVVEIRRSSGSTPIPFDHVVLSGSGSAATKLLANVSPGAEIRISQEITHFDSSCSGPSGPDWSKTYASVSASFDFLRGGVIDPHSDNAGATALNPRTAIAFNNEFIYFIVVDGRRNDSIGMSMQQLGEFCRDTLGATDGVNQDGGGSSAMWLDGAIVNQPSDGQERATYNGLAMVSLIPATQTSTHSVGAPVQTTRETALRQGPGANFISFGAIPAGRTGQVVSHPLNGIQATDAHWWLVRFEESEGWIQAPALESLTGNETWKVQ